MAYIVSKIYFIETIRYRLVGLLFIQIELKFQ